MDKERSIEKMNILQVDLRNVTFLRPSDKSQKNGTLNSTKRNATATLVIEVNEL